MANKIKRLNPRKLAEKMSKKKPPMRALANPHQFLGEAKRLITITRIKTKLGTKPKTEKWIKKLP